MATLTACSSEKEHNTDKAPAAAATPQHPAKPPTPLVQQALPNVKGKTFTSRIVEFPPAGSAAPHRHGDAFVYAYVLGGTVRSKIDDGPMRTYHRLGGPRGAGFLGGHRETADPLQDLGPAATVASAATWPFTVGPVQGSVVRATRSRPGAVRIASAYGRAGEETTRPSGRGAPEGS